MNQKMRKKIILGAAAISALCFVGGYATADFLINRQPGQFSSLTLGNASVQHLQTSDLANLSPVLNLSKGDVQLAGADDRPQSQSNFRLSQLPSFVEAEYVYSAQEQQLDEENNPTRSPFHQSGFISDSEFTSLTTLDDQSAADLDVTQQ